MENTVGSFYGNFTLDTPQQSSSIANRSQKRTWGEACPFRWFVFARQAGSEMAMSLMDALLLEPPKFEVWLALRPDGTLGSGTQADPYDGSAIKTAPLSISGLTNPGASKLEAIAVTMTNHEFLKGDIVVISRETNPANGDWWDGTFEVGEVLSSTSFKYVMQREPVAAVSSNRTVQKYLAWRFDERMKEAPERTTIHIGPGVFETRGAGEGEIVPPGWRAKNGQRILGAGMGLTTLKLVAPSVPVGNRKAAVIAANQVLTESLEIADLTLDCNADDQPGELRPDGQPRHFNYAAISIDAGGRHIYIHRVRAINFASRYPDGYSENFVFYAVPDLTNPLVDMIWEDCVAEHPSANNHANSFMFSTGGAAENTTGGAVKTQSHGCVIRHCYIDGRNRYGPVVQIATISRVGSVVTVVTKSPHGHRKPGNLLVRGVSADGSFTNAYNGVFEIDEIDAVDPAKLKYKLPAGAAPGAATGGTIGGSVSSTQVAVDVQIPPAVTGISAVTDPLTGQPYPRRFKLRTRDPHFRTTNNTIMLQKVYKVGTGKTIASAALYGAFPIVKYDPSLPNELEFTIYRDLDIPLSELDLGWASAKFGHLGTGSDDSITENNYISHVDIGGPYQDTWSRRTVMARDNYYHDVNIGPMQLLGRASQWWGGAIRLESLDYDDSELVCPVLALHSFAEYENSIAIARLYHTDPGSQQYVGWTSHSFVKGDFVSIVADSSTDKSI